MKKLFLYISIVFILSLLTFCQPNGSNTINHKETKDIDSLIFNSNTNKSDTINKSLNDSIVSQSNGTINWSNILDTSSPVTYNINSNSDTILILKQSVIYIPKGAFLGTDKKKINDKVKLYIKEVKSASDIITDGLYTISNNKILESKEMIYIAAIDENGNKLDLIKPLTIEMVNKNIEKDDYVFYGNPNSNNTIEWVKTGALIQTMIPIPSQYLDFTYYYVSRYYKNEKGELCPEGKEHWDQLLREVENDKYYNTFISTREFRDRFRFLISITSSYYQKTDYKILVNYYLNNLDKNLWEVDLMISQKLKNDYFYKYSKDKSGDIESFFKQEIVKELPIDSIYWEYKNLTSLGYSKKEIELIMERRDFKRNIIKFINYSNQRKTHVEKIPAEIVGMTNEDMVYSTLKSKGYKSENIDKILVSFRLQIQIIKSLQNSKKLLDFTSNQFRINKFGWVNIDKFINGSSSLKIAIKDKTLINSEYSAYIILLDRNSIIKQNSSKGQILISGLPLDENASILCLSYNDKLGTLYSFNTLSLKKNNNIYVDLHKTDLKKLKMLIENLNKKWPAGNMAYK